MISIKHTCIEFILLINLQESVCKNGFFFYFLKQVLCSMRWIQSSWLAPFFLAWPIAVNGFPHAKHRCSISMQMRLKIFRFYLSFFDGHQYQRSFLFFLTINFTFLKNNKFSHFTFWWVSKEIIQANEF
jgi:hypothetical protein